MSDHTTVEQRLQRPMTSMALAFLGSEDATLCDVHTVAMWCLAQMRGFTASMLEEEDVVMDPEMIAAYTRMEIRLEEAMEMAGDLPFSEFD